MSRPRPNRPPDLGCSHCGGTGWLIATAEPLEPRLRAVAGEHGTPVASAFVPEGQVYVIACRCTIALDLSLRSILDPPEHRP